MLSAFYDRYHRTTRTEFPRQSPHTLTARLKEPLHLSNQDFIQVISYFLTEELHHAAEHFRPSALLDSTHDPLQQCSSKTQRGATESTTACGVHSLYGATAGFYLFFQDTRWKY